MSIFALLFLAPPLAEFALRFGAQEYFLLAIFGVSVIASLSERNMLKGLWSGVLGLFLSVIGMHPLTGDIRFTGGIAELYNGLSLVIALIGLYSIPEVIASLKSLGGEVEQSRTVGRGIAGQMLEIFKYNLLLVKSTVIGIIVGIIPGAGSSIASFVAYDEAKRSSKIHKYLAPAARRELSPPKRRTTPLLAVRWSRLLLLVFRETPCLPFCLAG